MDKMVKYKFIDYKDEILLILSGILGLISLFIFGINDNQTLLCFFIMFLYDVKIGINDVLKIDEVKRK